MDVDYLYCLEIKALNNIKNNFINTKSFMTEINKKMYTNELNWLIELYKREENKRKISDVS